MTTNFFENRKEAGKKLAAELKKLPLSNPLILGLPRGGVVVAKEVADALSAELDVLLVRKLGAPFNSELAVGAIVEGDQKHEFLNQELIRVLKVDDGYLNKERQKQWDEIERRSKLFRTQKPRMKTAGREVVVVDDGIATGASVRAALLALRSQKPAQLILAVPVIAPDILEVIQSEVDRVVALVTPDDFRAVGQYFRDFRQVEDEEVVALLKK